MSDNEIKIKVKELLLMSIKKKAEIEDSTDLLKGHILDSISFVQLVGQLEKNFSIKYGILELSVDRFSTVDAIAEGVEEKIKSLNK